MTDYRERITIDHEGDKEFQFFTISGQLIATGYVRIVFGQRGPYVEFKKGQVIRDNIYVPKSCEWRLESCVVYYYEYRTKKDYVMVYLQSKVVDYADYKVGFVYISPFYLYDKNGKVIIEKL